MALFDKKETVTVSPEVAACQRKIVELNQQRAETLRQIGELYLENYDPEKLEGSPYEAKVKAVQALDREKDFQEKRMLAVQGQRKCEKCGNILVLDSAFCNKCGEKLEPLFAEELKKQRICPQCGAPCGEGAVFCTACGQKLG